MTTGSDAMRKTLALTSGSEVSTEFFSSRPTEQGLTLLDQRTARRKLVSLNPAKHRRSDVPESRLGALKFLNRRESDERVAHGDNIRARRVGKDLTNRLDVFLLLVKAMG